MMQKTALRTMEITGQDAARVARRLLGDLLAIHETYGMGTESYFQDLAHDLEMGLYHRCLTTIRFRLFPTGSAIEDEILVYEVVDGEIVSSSHSGRLVYNPRLDGGRFQVHVTYCNGWNALKGGTLKLNWTEGDAPSTAAMTATPDGGYGSGALRVSRTAFRRAG